MTGKEKLARVLKCCIYTRVPVLVIGLVALSSGCLMFGAISSITDRDIEYIREITDSMVQRVQIGNIFELKVDLFLSEVRDGEGYWHMVEIPAGLQQNMQKRPMPDSIHSYRANPKNWPHIVGVLPKGSQVEILQLNENISYGLGKCHGTLVGENSMGLSAVIMDLTLLDARRRQEEPSILIPDPRFLEIAVAKS